MALSPDTGYFPFTAGMLPVWLSDERGCFGMTNAFVCFNSDRSLHSADISGKSMCLLRSRNTFMSMVVLSPGVCAVDVVDASDAKAVLTALDISWRFN